MHQCNRNSRCSACQHTEHMLGGQDTYKGSVISKSLQVMHDQACHLPLLYPMQGIPQDSLPLFLLAGDDVTTGSHDFLSRPHPILDESANQKPTLLVTPLHMHPKSRTSMPMFIILLDFIEETSTAHSSSCLGFQP